MILRPAIRFALWYDRASKRIEIEPENEASFAWLHREDVVRVLSSFLGELRGSKIVVDDRDEIASPPPGVVTPRYVARCMQSKLAGSFPEDEPVVSFDALRSAPVHDCPHCTCARG